MKEFNGTQIYVGDIIKLKKGQKSPCDMLVLAAGEFFNGKFVCKIDAHVSNGSSTQTIVEAISLTKPFNLYAENDANAKEFLKRMNGNISYKKTPQRDQIVGSLKLKSDPKIDPFDTKNIVKMGSILNTGFIYGMVLYNGNDCLERLSTKQNYFKKMSRFQNSINLFTILLVVICTIAGVLGSLLYRRVRTLEGSSQYHVRTNVGFISHMSNFYSTLPLVINIITNVFNLISLNILQNAFRNKDQKSESKFSDLFSVENENVKESFRIFDPSVIVDLGEIDDAFFDKTGTLVSTNFDVRSIAADGRIYFAGPNGFASQKDPKLIANNSSKVPDPVPRSQGKVGPDGNVLMTLTNEIAEEDLAAGSRREKGFKINQLPRSSKVFLQKNADKKEGGSRKSIPLPKGSDRKGFSIPSTTFDETKFLEDVEKKNPVLSNLLTTFTICQAATPTEAGFETVYNEEKAMLEFAKSFGTLFESELPEIEEETPEQTDQQPNEDIKKNGGDLLAPERLQVESEEINNDEDDEEEDDNFGVYNIRLQDGQYNHIKYLLKLHPEASKGWFLRLRKKQIRYPCGRSRGRHLHFIRERNGRLHANTDRLQRIRAELQQAGGHESRKRTENDGLRQQSNPSRRSPFDPLRVQSSAKDESRFGQQACKNRRRTGEGSQV